MSTTGASRGDIFGRGRGPIKRNVPSRSARRCSAGASTPKRCRPHSTIGCSGVFCRSREGAPFDPGVRCFLRDARGIPRSASTSRARARPRALARAGLRPPGYAPSDARAGSIPPHGQRMALASARRPASTAAAGANDTKEPHWSGYAFEFARILFLRDEQPCHVALDAQVDDGDGAGSRRVLDTGRHVRRFAKHFSGRVNRRPSRFRCQ